jgi:hypothetical protein
LKGSPEFQDNGQSMTIGTMKSARDASCKIFRKKILQMRILTLNLKLMPIFPSIILLD